MGTHGFGGAAACRGCGLITSLLGRTWIFGPCWRIHTHTLSLSLSFYWGVGVPRLHSMYVCERFFFRILLLVLLSRAHGPILKLREQYWLKRGFLLQEPLLLRLRVDVYCSGIVLLIESNEHLDDIQTGAAARIRMDLGPAAQPGFFMNGLE